jgi:hypothetical protein
MSWGSSRHQKQQQYLKKLMQISQLRWKKLPNMLKRHIPINGFPCRLIEPNLPFPVGLLLHRPRKKKKVLIIKEALKEMTIGYIPRNNKSLMP